MLTNYTSTYYDPLPYLVFSALFPIFVGMIIRLPRLMTDILNKKKWSVNWGKLLGIGIPLAYTSLSPILFFINVPSKLANQWNHQIFSLNLSMTSIAGVIFGYILLDCLMQNKNE